MSDKKQSTIKTVIIILSVLLAVSVLSLAGTLVYNHFISEKPASVTVPDNIITPEKDTASSDASDISSATESGTSSVSQTAAENGNNTQADVIASALSLHKRIIILKASL